MDELSLPFDVVVVGAGVNGLGIARDAALRGLRVVLLEQDDLCSGVSAWSGRLVHGGLRYLEHRDFALVRESLRERELLFRLAPHLVKPVRLLMPFYAHNRRPPWMIRLGMVLYDGLSFDKKTGRHEILDKAGITARFTGIGTEGLTGSAVFTDGQVEAAERLCVELAVAAAGDGAVIRTKARVDEPILENGRVAGRAVPRHRPPASTTRCAPRSSTTWPGPWIDRVFPGATGQPRLNGGTKGSHLIVDPFPGAPRDVVYYESQADGRLVLVIPWMGRYLLGTTDIRFDDDPDDARCDADEMAYILGEVNTLVPGANLTPDDVLYTYSGVRPLPYAPDKKESDVPRTHVLHEHGGDLAGLDHGRRREADDLPPARRGRRRRRVQTAGPQGPAAASRAGCRSPARSPIPAPLRGGPGRGGRAGAHRGPAAQALRPPGRRRRSRSSRSGAAAASSTRTAARSAPSWSSPCATSSPARSPTCWRAGCCSPSNPGTAWRRWSGPRRSWAPSSGWDEERRKEEIAEYQRWLTHLAIPEAGDVTGAT